MASLKVGNCLLYNCFLFHLFEFDIISITLQLIGENGEVKQEHLPRIDDNCNQLEVAEYVDEIYQYYWVMEVIIHFY